MKVGIFKNKICFTWIKSSPSLFEIFVEVTLPRESLILNLVKFSENGKREVIERKSNTNFSSKFYKKNTEVYFPQDLPEFNNSQENE